MFYFLRPPKIPHTLRRTRNLDDRLSYIDKLTVLLDENPKKDFIRYDSDNFRITFDGKFSVSRNLKSEKATAEEISAFRRIVLEQKTHPAISEFLKRHKNFQNSIWERLFERHM